MSKRKQARKLYRKPGRSSSKPRPFRLPFGQRVVRLTKPNKDGVEADRAVVELGVISEPTLNSSESEFSTVEEELIMSKKRPSILRRIIGILVVILILAGLSAAGYFVYQNFMIKKVITDDPTPITNIKQTGEVQTGKILASDTATVFTPEQTLALIRQTNPTYAGSVGSGIDKRTIRYSTSDGKSNDIPVHGRVYTPIKPTSARLPVLAFAPGTIGVGDACAGTLEQPAKRNWANYDSLMAAYAAQGYIVVITDYEGIRDPSRIHHYMIGELEGRAVLDSIRAVRNLDSTKNLIDSDELFVAGYSQGGHAAYWADMIAASYAPDLKLQGAIGFGPVTSVEETLTDAITNNANINWFGPYVLFTYQDWYRQNLNPDKVLLPQWNKNLRADVLRECIDSALHYWPNNQGANRSASVYTPEFIAAAKSNTLSKNASYKSFAADMAKNIVGNNKTATPKLINQGLYDNVVLARQNKAALGRFCRSGNIASYREYDKSPAAVHAHNPLGFVDHYQTMNSSLADTLQWMKDIIDGGTPPNNCT